MVLTLNDLEDELGVDPEKVEKDSSRTVDYISTGIDLLDYNVCGIGGFPRGRFSTTFAKESAGKTTFWLYIAGQIIKNGGLVTWVNAGEGFTWEYAEMCGCKSLHDTDKGVAGLDLMEDFTTGEDLLYKLKQRLALNYYDLIVVDSADKLVPQTLQEAKSEKQSQYENQQKAKMFSEFVTTLDGFRIKDKNGKIIPSEHSYLQVNPKNGKMEEQNDWHKFTRKKTHLAFIQHALDDLQALNPSAVTTTGGRRLMFEASLRIYIKLRQTKRNSKGNLEYKRIEVRPVKNKVFSNMPKGGELLLYPDGTLESADNSFFVNIAVDKGLINQRGAWYYYKGDDINKYIKEDEDELKWQGSDAVLEWIKKQDGMKSKILSL